MKLEQYPLTAEAQEYANNHAFNGSVRVNVKYEIKDGYMCEIWRAGRHNILARKQPIDEYNEEKRKNEESFRALLAELTVCEIRDN